MRPQRHRPTVDFRSADFEGANHDQAASDTAAVLEPNKAIAVEFLDRVTAHDIDGLIARTTADWRMFGGPPGLPQGAEGIRKLFGTFGRIEQTWTMDDVVAEGDRVVIRATNNCTSAAAGCADRATRG